MAEIKKIKKGETVSYNGLFTAKKDMFIAVCLIGYADGVFWQWFNSIFLILRVFGNNKRSFVPREKPVLNLRNTGHVYYILKLFLRIWYTVK